SRAWRGSLRTSSRTSGVRDEATQPAIPVEAGKRRPTRNCSSSLATAAKTSSFASSSRRRIDEALAPKIDRATSTIARRSLPNVSSAGSTPAATAARSLSSLIPRHVVRRQVEHRLQLERPKAGMLAEDQRGDTRDARRGEAVARRADRRASDPGDVDVDAAREELDGRIRVGVVDERVGLLVAAHGDDRREAPRERLDGHVVRGCDQHGATKVRAVGDLAQQVAELLLGGREAHVDHVEAFLDGPPKPGEKRLPGAREVRTEDAHGVDLGIRRERAYDAGAGGAVAAEVALFVGTGDRLAFLVDRHGDRSRELADGRMPRLDAAVEPAYAHSRSTRSGSGLTSAMPSAASGRSDHAGRGPVLESSWATTDIRPM